MSRSLSPSVSEPSYSESPEQHSRLDHMGNTIRFVPRTPHSQPQENNTAQGPSLSRSRSLQDSPQARRLGNTGADHERSSRVHTNSPRSAVSAQSPVPFRSSPRNEKESPQVVKRARRNSNTVVDHGRSSHVQVNSPQSNLSVQSPVSPRSSPRRGRDSRTSAARDISNDVSPFSSPSSSRRPILFYHKHEPHYGFTNFSPHPVYYKEKRYPTSEHLFQSFKFSYKPGLAEHIRTCDPRPSKAFSEARRFQPEVRSDWKRVNIQLMDEALWHKFNQHGDLREELLDTGNAELVENSDKDAFWGIGSDGKGRNELGRALERLRTQLRT